MTVLHLCMHRTPASVHPPLHGIKSGIEKGASKILVKTKCLTNKHQTRTNRSGSRQIPWRWSHPTSDLTERIRTSDLEIASPAPYHYATESPTRLQFQIIFCMFGMLNANRGQNNYNTETDFKLKVDISMIKWYIYSENLWYVYFIIIIIIIIIIILL